MRFGLSDLDELPSLKEFEQLGAARRWVRTRELLHIEPKTRLLLNRRGCVPESGGFSGSNCEWVDAAVPPASPCRRIRYTTALQKESPESDDPEADVTPTRGEGGKRSKLEPFMLERLQKIIARAGIASRRHSEEPIRSGQARVNGVSCHRTRRQSRSGTGSRGSRRQGCQYF